MEKETNYILISNIKDKEIKDLQKRIGFLETFTLLAGGTLCYIIYNITKILDKHSKALDDDTKGE